MQLVDLPDEMLLNIIDFCHYRDILMLGVTGRSNQHITKMYLKLHNIQLFYYYQSFPELAASIDPNKKIVYDLYTGEEYQQTHIYIGKYDIEQCMINNIKSTIIFGSDRIPTKLCSTELVKQISPNLTKVEYFDEDILSDQANFYHKYLNIDENISIDSITTCRYYYNVDAHLLILYNGYNYYYIENVSEFTVGQQLVKYVANGISYEFASQQIQFNTIDKGWHYTDCQMKLLVVRNHIIIERPHKNSRDEIIGVLPCISYERF